MRKDQFESPDHYMVDKLFSDEQLMVRDATRQWVKEYVSPVIEDCNLKGVFPKELIKGISEIGGFGAILPARYGGSELDLISYGLMMQEMERGDSSIRVMCSIQTSLVMNNIYEHGNDFHKEEFLLKLSRGELIGSFGLSEPGHGSDPGSMQTRHTLEGDHYTINGSKMWIGNAPFCDIALVWSKGTDGNYACFIVHRNDPGFSTSKIDKKWSFRASETGELIFNNCKVHKKYLLFKSKTIGSALKSLNIARYAVACGSIGIAMECYDVALKYSDERIQFGKKIASNQLVQKKLVDMITEITKAQLLNWKLGVMMNDGEATFEQISMAKRNNVSVAYNVARHARQILGGMGITAEYPVMRHLINLETLITYQGTDEIHTLITGRNITGISAF
tara:strand:- start:6426 stop:7601 length:1176 start_codon:yes stop_codon:yes gene_type:complete